ncbi:MAG TPA: type II toxin-antitoxin system VapC family toxin [Gemmataceae bacterium]|jgi:tRNA(fMet)-specific endonuclease VapC
MSPFLLDTDMLSLLEQGHPRVLQQVNNHPQPDIALSVISIQEQMQGFLASLSRARNRQQLALAYDMLRTRLLPVWGRFAVISFPETAILRFEQLQSLRLNVGLMDLRIAAVALENSLTVITRNQRDFGRVPGLAVVNWSI